MATVPALQGIVDKHELKDSDGIPPGLDLELFGQQKIIKFSGHFYAQPEQKYVEFGRPVFIIFASPEVYVAKDLEMGNLYVVDRAKKLSLGCRMTADLLDFPPSYKIRTKQARRFPEGD
jgi:hypothetical protein